MPGTIGAQRPSGGGLVGSGSSAGGPSGGGGRSVTRSMGRLAAPPPGSGLKASTSTGHLNLLALAIENSARSSSSSLNHAATVGAGGSRKRLPWPVPAPDAIAAALAAAAASSEPPSAATGIEESVGRRSSDAGSEGGASAADVYYSGGDCDSPMGSVSRQASIGGACARRGRLSGSSFLRVPAAHLPRASEKESPPAALSALASAAAAEIASAAAEGALASDTPLLTLLAPRGPAGPLAAELAVPYAAMRVDLADLEAALMALSLSPAERRPAQARAASRWFRLCVAPQWQLALQAVRLELLPFLQRRGPLPPRLHRLQEATHDAVDAVLRQVRHLTRILTDGGGASASSVPASGHAGAGAVAAVLELPFTEAQDELRRACALLVTCATAHVAEERRSLCTLLEAHFTAREAAAFAPRLWAFWVSPHDCDEGGEGDGDGDGEGEWDGDGEVDGDGDEDAAASVGHMASAVAPAPDSDEADADALRPYLHLRLRLPWLLQGLSSEADEDVLLDRLVLPRAVREAARASWRQGWREMRSAAAAR